MASWGISTVTKEEEQWGIVMSSNNFPKAPCPVLEATNSPCATNLPKVFPEDQDLSPRVIYQGHICLHCSDTTSFWIKTSDTLRCPGLCRSKSTKHMKPKFKKPDLSTQSATLHFIPIKMTREKLWFHPSWVFFSVTAKRKLLFSSYLAVGSSPTYTEII